MIIEPRNQYVSEAHVPLTGPAYYLDHFYGLPGVLAHKIKATFKLAWRCAHLGLVKAGMPVRRPFLVLGCPGGTDASGFFAEFGSVLGMLEHYDRWTGLYAGVRVDFKDQGLYYDPARGPNWWNYYFEPFDVGASGSHADLVVALRQHDVYAHRVENTLPRCKGAALINRYVRVRPHIRAKAEAFALSHFAERHVIGVHYRGTDKIKEAPRVSYETVGAAIQDAMGSMRDERISIFAATDEQAFLEYLQRLFPDLVCHRETVRSVDGRRIHDSDRHNYRKGEEALVDCLLLSGCDLLIRTESNLGLCATFFNPAIPQVLLNRAAP